jgi:lysophospholipase L1-like esterase
MHIPKILLNLTLALAAAVLPLRAAEEEQVLVPAVELTARNGLPNFFAKLNAGKEVRVGYLGGSITAAPGWRVKSLAWLQQQYPTAKLSEINAAIGGTGSDLGVFRANQDVISKKPDLLFVEFAVNDGGAPPDRIQKTMEGIVRQTWKADPATDICFVYTLSEPFLKDLQAGKFPRAASAMEGVANHYGIPSIHFGLEVTKQLADGKLIFKSAKDAPLPAGQTAFSNDGVHPLVETGHEIYQTVIARSFTAMKSTGKAAPHPTIAPLRADNWEAAKIVPITPAMLKGKWTKLDPTQPGRAKDFSNRMPVMWKTEEPGSSLEFTVQGTVAQVYDLLSPDGGEVEIQINDQKPSRVPRFDQHSVYPRLGTLSVFSLPAPARNAVKITLTATVLDKAKILSDGNRPAMEKSPEQYKNIAWHVGSLMIIGDLVE